MKQADNQECAPFCQDDAAVASMLDLCLQPEAPLNTALFNFWCVASRLSRALHLFCCPSLQAFYVSASPTRLLA